MALEHNRCYWYPIWKPIWLNWEIPVTDFRMSFCKNTILAVIDTCLCLFVFFPLSVIHWRGTWDLLDAYIIPDDLFYSSWVSFAIGATACFFGYMLQPQLSKWSLGRGRICHGFVVRIYMYLFSWAILCYWRGTWNLMDLYMGEGIPNALLWYGIAIGLSVLFRTSRTIAGIPMQIQVDTDPEFCLEPDTRFKIQVKCYSTARKKISGIWQY